MKDTLSSFWESLDSLVRSSKLVIDCPRGSTHPRYPTLVYPLGYGYLEGTMSGDGDGIDVWRGSLAEDLLDAVVCTVDRVKKEVEIKPLLGCMEAKKTIVLDILNNGGSRPPHKSSSSGHSLRSSLFDPSCYGEDQDEFQFSCFFSD